MTVPGQGLTCPSAPAEPGALLLGVVGSAGRVVPLRTAMAVDAGFVATAPAAGPPEARMRFASPCREGGCAQWTGERCGVIAKVLDHLRPTEPAALPPCLIRAPCRWFAERAAAACGVCNLIVTDQTG
ncbi:MAG TPA: hypothetical protein PKC84_12085, partial [Paracoccaceae bacterium]|nr:hypothetical protein [Paracoccaceae bacterium]